MNFFTRNLALSHKDILEKRAKAIAKSAERSQRGKVDQLDKELDEIDSQISDLEDLNRDNTTSLNPTAGNFNAEEWVKKLHDLQLKRQLKAVELKIAKDTYKKYFVEEDSTNPEDTDDSTEQK